MKMKFELTDYQRKMSDSDIIADIIAVAKKLDTGTLSLKDYAVHGKYHGNSVRKRFGSWYFALKRAGLKPAKAPWNMKVITKDKLFKNLAEAWIQLGRQPKQREMKLPLSAYSGSVYIRVFGSWMTALRKFIEHENAISSGANPVEEPVEAAQNETMPAPENEIMKCKPTNRGPREVSSRLRVSVFIRDGFRCAICGRSTITHPGLELHCDHIRPWSKDGDSTMKNLQTLCAECNIGKGNMLVGK